MTRTMHLTVDIYVDEHDGDTRAEARLHHPDGPLHTGHGTARRNPGDAEVAEIGDEVAISRALSDLATQLLDAASGDIAAVTNKPVHLNQ
ncbi:MAG: DUF1876 domain-containing protein [Oryzihumus sp.]